VTHDLNLAAAFADRLVVLHAGRIAADAAPSEVLSAETVRRVFGVDVRIAQDPGGKPWILYGG
jgi:iron complex transport system ATP-binding protein